jgi:hypothetical protein
MIAGRPGHLKHTHPAGTGENHFSCEAVGAVPRFHLHLLADGLLSGVTEAETSPQDPHYLWQAVKPLLIHALLFPLIGRSGLGHMVKASNRGRYLAVSQLFPIFSCYPPWRCGITARRRRLVNGIANTALVSPVSVIVSGLTWSLFLVFCDLCHHRTRILHAPTQGSLRTFQQLFRRSSAHTLNLPSSPKIASILQRAPMPASLTHATLELFVYVGTFGVCPSRDPCYQENHSVSSEKNTCMPRPLKGSSV